MPYNVIAVQQKDNVITEVVVQQVPATTEPIPFKATAAAVAHAISEMNVKFFVNNTPVLAYPENNPQHIRTKANESAGDNLEFPGMPSVVEYEKVHGERRRKHWKK